jgi:hypothetical protein
VFAALLVALPAMLRRHRFVTQGMIPALKLSPGRQ